MISSVKPSWQPLIDAFFAGQDGRDLLCRLEQRISAVGAEHIYPSEPLRALSLTGLDEVKVVILGQDPYHGPGQANGLAFSVNKGIKLPPSLRNIFKELDSSVGGSSLVDGDLTPWAEQGCLLLNTVLTVEKSRPASHAKLGWENLTNQIIAAVARQKKPVVFMLWGMHAQAKLALIEQHSDTHLILKSNHPSPFSALRGPTPFIGCGHFKTANEWLADHGLEPIRW